MRTALLESMTINLRQRRADALASAVMNAIGDFIVDGEKRAVSNALRGLFSSEGIEVLSDHDRAGHGLPPRGPEGWTSAELYALEMARLTAMTQPIQPFIFRTETAQQRPTSTETNVNEQGTEGDSGTNKAG